MTVAIALAALLVALAALLLAGLVARQSGALAVTLNRHRLGHEQREGAKDPAPDRERRRLNLGPPRSVGERRMSPGQVLPPEDMTPDGLADAATQEHPVPTAERPAVPRLPRPGQIGTR